MWYTFFLSCFYFEYLIDLMHFYPIHFVKFKIGFKKINKFLQLLHTCIDEICNCNGAKFQQFTNLDWNKEEFIKVQNFFFQLFHNPNCLFIDTEKVSEYHYFFY